ncbi:hypothetical protein [Eggerthella sinensis]|uniref:SbsA Ig-like domain-containing protein n=1 Tax=Eggerthella sinensis TaxID=242230 RepID=A0A3N0IRW5_9ACTN|nr:hypothetical protein [Eggerthella sinensis]RDB69901.1 hypothetical protein C1876_05805 [Eggerthella sinensis]RNM39190.1 hypothetical protein DMP09_16915 [Eggerthella sinensis]
MRDETKRGSVRARGALGRARAALRAAAACALIAGALACAGCAQARVDDASPRLSDVQLTAAGAQSEASQSVEIKLTFDQPISAAGAVADDFEVLLNGKELEGGAVALDVRPSAQAVTFVLHPSSTASAGGATGSFFALYQCAFSIAAAREDGALPSVTGATGSCAVLDAPVTGTLPSGLALETMEARAGSSDGGVAAQTTVRVTSPALVRAITWFSPDGGSTVLLKHNHTFADADAAACAADLAKVVNEAAGLGLSARASGDELTITAADVRDGQTLDPVIVEGVGVEGGAYDASLGTGEEG